MIISNSIIFIPLLTGSVFAFAGFIMLKYPPKNINGFYGYRTSSSMKSIERWEFAQIYSAKEMIKVGGLLLLSSTLGLVYEPTEGAALAIGLGLIVIAVVILILRVEKAIKKRFKPQIDNDRRE